jgi:predicted ATPase
MIESIEFKNFKCLRDATLPLSPCTILVGANGTGKTTVLQALEAVRAPNNFKLAVILTAGVPEVNEAGAEVRLNWGDPHHGVHHCTRWSIRGESSQGIEFSGGREECDAAAIGDAISAMRVFCFDPEAIAAFTPVSEATQLEKNGKGLAAVIDALHDSEPERFDAITAELGGWLPEFDRILFDRPHGGHKSIVLRTRDGHHKIPASNLSQGTLLALTMLTLAYLPNPPWLIGLEEPDRSIHPRLLRRVQDAIYRLSHPESCGEKREPVQVIATTHSPYFLDLFKDHPEEIVIANKIGLDVQFQRLSEQPHIQELLEDSHLGDIWYTGILGGVPANS